MDTFSCTCCRLEHPRTQLRAAAFVDHTPQTLCALCELHQGNYLARAENHEAQLRFRLDEANRVGGGRRDTTLGGATPTARVGECGFGGCRCGERACATYVVLADPWLNRHIAVDERRDQSA